MEKLIKLSVLLTGGAGFIGSHTAIKLLEAGCTVTIVDNLSNSKEKVIDRIKEIVGSELSNHLNFHKLDVKDTKSLTQLLKDSNTAAVIHFAGLKAVGESVELPLKYYDENINATISVLHAMETSNVKHLLFSSSATVYGERAKPPFTESTPTDLEGISNPYGQTKLMIEQILSNYQKSNANMSISLLRYFNPIGAHPSGLIGEDPQGIPNNLMPYITRVAVGNLQELTVFGSDYDTRDGTCERDYLHVCDLADGHVAALKKQLETQERGLNIFNLGTGQSSTVLEVIKAFQSASNQEIPYKLGDRRSGDVAITYANVDKAKEQLNWSTKLSLEDACRDSWNWQSKNPLGF